MKTNGNDWSPKITLKVRDPNTREFINHMDLRGGIQVNPEDLANIPWQLNPDQHLNQYTTPWTHQDNEI